MVAVFCRSPYNYDMNEISDLTGLMCQDESRTVQSERDEVDINTIVERFGLTGQLPDDNYRAPQSADFVGIYDYQTALNSVIEAERSFMALPAKLRARFGNDPQLLLEFLSDDANRDEAVKFGLLKPVEEPPKPMEVRVMGGALDAVVEPKA